MLANVYVDITKEGKTTTKDVRLETIAELQDLLSELNIHSRFQAEIYVTDGIIKINVRA